MTSGVIETSKKFLRNSIQDILSSIAPGEIQFQSGLVCSHVVSHPVFQRARVVSCYLSMPTAELDTRQLVLSILNAGKILFVPRINRQRDEIEMLRIYDEQDLNRLKTGLWGIPDPGLERNGSRRQNVMDLECPVLDLILLPGLAFDQYMSRLGHGKGYYDRFLRLYQLCMASRYDLTSIERPVLFGLSLTQQLVIPPQGPIPTTDHDVSVDGVFHPRGLIVKQ